MSRRGAHSVPSNADLPPDTLRNGKRRNQQLSASAESIIPPTQASETLTRSRSEELEADLIRETSENQFFLEDSMLGYTMRTPRTSEDDYTDKELVESTLNDIAKVIKRHLGSEI